MLKVTAEVEKLDGFAMTIRYEVSNDVEMKRYVNRVTSPIYLLHCEGYLKTMLGGVTKELISTVKDECFMKQARDEGQ